MFGLCAHGARLTIAQLEPLLDQLSEMDLPTRRAVPGLDPRRADVTCAGGYILLGVMQKLGLASCLVSDRGVRWGLLLDRFSPRL